MTHTQPTPVLVGLFSSIQTWLPPTPEDALGELDAKHQQFVAVCALCAPQKHAGWESLGDVPSEATFSRASDVFAQNDLPRSIHETLIKTHNGDKLVGHVSRDATAIHAWPR